MRMFLYSNGSSGILQDHRDSFCGGFGGGMTVRSEATLEIVCEKDTVRCGGIRPLPIP